MSDPFVGEIMMAGFSFAPVDYALCQGQIMSISQYAALYSLIGAQFGGNGQTDFGLPDLQGRAPMHLSTGVGIGDQYGFEAVALTINETGHRHPFLGSANEGTFFLPFDATTGEGYMPAQIPAFDSPAYHAASAASLATIGTTSIEASGSGLPHDNMQPYLVITFCIAMKGLYPPRS